MDDMQRFEETEDCFILGFDPFDIVPLSFDPSTPHHHADDLSLIAEKGQCYCYVCDAAGHGRPETGTAKQGWGFREKSKEYEETFTSNGASASL
ncbi:hypothetical protein VNO78_11126 [Psophocarpus tetragonolobus]|uniref:Uncharacterized protein n=1 Tax=Psophocarpus tetragonolobus TaxID=3891 RepID=A0AAN9SKV8_PSOTE